jgi:hypothetical protein
LNARESSLLAYDEIQADGMATTKRAAIASWLSRHPRSSRADIVRGTGFTINCVCGRVAELLEDHEIFEREIDKVDPVTGKKVNTLEVAPVQRALDL